MDPCLSRGSGKILSQLKAFATTCCHIGILSSRNSPFSKTGAPRIRKCPAATLPRLVMHNAGRCARTNIFLYTATTYLRGCLYSITYSIRAKFPDKLPGMVKSVRACITNMNTTGPRKCEGLCPSTVIYSISAWIRHVKLLHIRE